MIRGKIISEVWSGGKEGERAESFCGGGGGVQTRMGAKSREFFGMGALGFVKIRGSFFDIRVQKTWLVRLFLMLLRGAS